MRLRLGPVSVHFGVREAVFSAAFLSGVVCNPAAERARDTAERQRAYAECFWLPETCNARLIIDRHTGEETWEWNGHGH